jgi:hypothetical protein
MQVSRSGSKKKNPMFVLAFIALLCHGWKQIAKESLYFPSFNTIDVGQTQLRDVMYTQSVAFHEPALEPDHLKQQPDTMFSVLVDWFSTAKTTFNSEVCIPRVCALTMRVDAVP